MCFPKFPEDFQKDPKMFEYPLLLFYFLEIIFLLIFFFTLDMVPSTLDIEP